MTYDNIYWRHVGELTLAKIPRDKWEDFITWVSKDKLDIYESSEDNRNHLVDLFMHNGIEEHLRVSEGL